MGFGDVSLSFTQEELRVLVISLDKYLADWKRYAHNRERSADAQMGVHGHTAEGRKSVEHMRVDVVVAHRHTAKVESLRDRLVDCVDPSTVL